MDLEKLNETLSMTSNQQRFIKELVRKIQHLQPRMLDEKWIEITPIVDRDGQYIKVSIPHKTVKDFNFWIALYNHEIIVFFSDVHEHFYPSENNQEDKEWILEALIFIIDLIKGKYRLETIYKGQKKVGAKLYSIESSSSEEIISSQWNLNLNILNPFLPIHVEEKKISFME